MVGKTGVQPGDAGFRVLTMHGAIAHAGGRMLNGEAIRRVGVAYDAGWGYDDLAELYDELKNQIERVDPGWRATRVICADGSHAFIGTYSQVLVVMPDRSIFLGIMTGVIGS